MSSASIPTSRVLLRVPALTSLHERPFPKLLLQQQKMRPIVTTTIITTAATTIDLGKWMWQREESSCLPKNILVFLPSYPSHLQSLGPSGSKSCHSARSQPLKMVPESTTIHLQGRRKKRSFCQGIAALLREVVLFECDPAPAATHLLTAPKPLPGRHLGIQAPE